MPIVDVEVVCDAQAAQLPGSASALAAALGRALKTQPGQTWVRLRTLEASCYAENELIVSSADLPVFVTVLHARPPEGAARAAEVATLTQTVATCIARSPERVHVQYAPAAVGRQAFGGALVK